MASTVVERYKAWDRDEVDAILEARRIRPPGAGRQQMMYGHEHHGEREVQLWEEHKEEVEDEESGGAVRAVGKGKDEIVRRRKSAPHALHTNVRLKEREEAAAAAEEEDDEPSVQQQSRARASLCIPRISRRKSNTFDLCELRSPTPHRRSVSQPMQHDLVHTSPPLHSNLQKMKMTNPWL
jgi:hypothetical protein